VGVPYLGSSGVGAACLQLFGLLKGEGAVRSRCWKAKPVPTPSSLTLSAGDGKDPRAPTPIPHSCRRPLGTAGRCFDRSPQTSEPGSKAELDKTTSAHCFWEHFQHSRVGLEPGLPMQPREQDVSRSVGTCLQRGDCVPQSQRCPVFQRCHYPVG